MKRLSHQRALTLGMLYMIISVGICVFGFETMHHYGRSAMDLWGWLITVLQPLVPFVRFYARQNPFFMLVGSFIALMAWSTVIGYTLAFLFRTDDSERVERRPKQPSLAMRTFALGMAYFIFSGGLSVFLYLSAIGAGIGGDSRTANSFADLLFVLQPLGMLALRLTAVNGSSQFMPVVIAVLAGMAVWSMLTGYVFALLIRWWQQAKQVDTVANE
jgi:hypothetical protein